MLNKDKFIKILSDIVLSIKQVAASASPTGLVLSHTFADNHNARSGPVQRGLDLGSVDRIGVVEKTLKPNVRTEVACLLLQDLAKLFRRHQDVHDVVRSLLARARL